VNPPVLLPAHIVLRQALRSPVTETDRAQAFLRETKIQKNAPNGLGALQCKAIVILDEPAIVSVPLDDDHQIRTLIEQRPERGSNLVELTALARGKDVRVDHEVQIWDRTGHPIRDPAWRRLETV
jgi:hypothetical protein